MRARLEHDRIAAKPGIGIFLFFIAHQNQSEQLLFLVSGGPAMLTDFSKESRDYPHVANVLDIIEDTTSYYVVMEHVKGKGILALRRRKRLEIEKGVQ